MSLFYFTLEGTNPSDLCNKVFCGFSCSSVFSSRPFVVAANGWSRNLCATSFCSLVHGDASGHVQRMGYLRSRRDANRVQQPASEALKRPSANDCKQGDFNDSLLLRGRVLHFAKA
jgi:hypothetical protein